MSMLEDRERAIETKFAHDEELKFKVMARRTKLVAHWAAGVMGLNAEAAAGYVQQLLATDLQEVGADDVVRRLTADFLAKGIDPHGLAIAEKMDEFLRVAHTQIMHG